eukprot:5138523-Pyramimonas_sp.AAC.1
MYYALPPARSLGSIHVETLSDFRRDLSGASLPLICTSRNIRRAFFAQHRIRGPLINSVVFGTHHIATCTTHRGVLSIALCAMHSTSFLKAGDTLLNG